MNLHDETSGIEQLDQRRAWHERHPSVFCDTLIWFTIGALTAATIFLFLK